MVKLLKFLKDNAMQVSGLCSAVLTIVFQFTHLSTQQTAAIVGGPPALGTFLAGMAINIRNGNGKANGSPQQPVDKVPTA